MRKLYSTYILSILFLFSCSSQNNEFSDNEMTLILDTAINNKQLNSSLSKLYLTQPLRLVRSDNLKKDYPLFKNGKPVVYVDIDSSSRKLTNWRKPKFYGNIQNFKIISDKKVEISLLFRDTGLWAIMEIIKIDKKWTISSFKNHTI
ncbi:MAG: hypothetical protein U5N85_00410 [Arcicella sp.]|nr:hypothetical protein [Arcicella sp.]